MSNTTLRIDPETRDLVFDENGNFELIADTDALIQNVRPTLLTWKAEFFADESHGTDYEQIMGLSQNEVQAEDSPVKEVIREAVFQEPNVSRINSITTEFENRTITVTLSATLVSGEEIYLEVTA